MTSSDKTPEERAEDAARDLSDRGQRVTARAVRELAGVQMSVANSAAKAWNEALSTDAVDIPEVPNDVQGRLVGIWADAYRAAYYAVTPERDRLAAQIKELRNEYDSLVNDFADLESEYKTAINAKEEALKKMETAKEEALEEMETLRDTVAKLKDESRTANREHETLTKEINRLHKQIESEKDDRLRLEDRLALLIKRIPERE